MVVVPHMHTMVNPAAVDSTGEVTARIKKSPLNNPLKSELVRNLIMRKWGYHLLMPQTESLVYSP